MFRVGQSRVLLELVLRAVRAAKHEGIVRSYPTLQLANVYTVIGRYLTNRAFSTTIYDSAKSKPYPCAMKSRRPNGRRLARRNSSPAPRKGIDPVIAFLVDQNFNEHIVDGLSRRDQSLSFTFVRDIGLAAALDPILLQWAAFAA